MTQTSESPRDERRPQRYSQDMTDAAQHVLDEALRLSNEERAALARDLIVSLEDAPYDPAEEVEAAWADEIRRRVARVRAGEPGIPANDVLTEARARLRKRRGQ